MKTVRSWLLRFAGLFQRHKDQDLVTEFETHLEMQIEANLHAGMNAREARRAALLKLGNVESAKELYRERNTLPWFEHWLRDWRYGLRQLRKNPVFALTAVSTLALGICASVSIFAFVDAALLKQLPYPHPKQLLGVFESTPDFPVTNNLSYLDYLDWKRLNTSFSSLEAYRPDGVILTTREGTDVAHSARVSAGFFRTLGIRPLLGRDFRAGEDLANAAPVVMLSYSAWQKRYGGRPDIIGRTIVDTGALKTIIGVLPRGFYFAPVEPAEFWSPVNPSSNCESRRGCHNLYGLGRLKNGVSIQGALANLKAIARQLEKQYPENRDQSANVIPLRDFIVGPIHRILLVLMAGAALLLIIAAVNVANLLLVRAESRKREMAVRSALGAGRIRLITQCAAETLTIVLAGSGLGLVAAYWLMQLLSKLIGSAALARMPYLQDLGLNSHVLLFASILAALAIPLFTATAALRTSFKAREYLSEGSRGSTGMTWRRAGSRLVVVELATATVLLAGAGLLVKSLYLVMRVDLGLAPDRLVTMKVGAPKTAYSKDAQILSLTRELLSKINNLPGVRSAAVSSDLPLEGWGDTTWFRIIGRPWHGEHNDTPERDVSTEYFRTIGAHLIRGRFFSEDEDASKPLVAIVNDTFAKHYFPGEDPIGKRIAGLSDKAPPMEIVGLVGDIKEGQIDTQNRPVLYFPFNQNLDAYFNLVVRTGMDEHALIPTLVSTIRQLDPRIATTEELTMHEKIETSQSAWLHRSAAWLVAGFALVALLLGIVGLYGVIAYSVAQRTREIGVRVALGAEQRLIYRLVLGEAALLAFAGLLAGVVCSVLASHWMESMLFGVHTWDLATLTAVAVTLGTGAIAASFFPARRAALVNPVEALRNE